MMHSKMGHPSRLGRVTRVTFAEAREEGALLSRLGRVGG
jgi:hypothetical protein